MTLVNGIPSIIHTPAEMNISAFTYYKVYAGADTTAIINGESVTMAGSSIIDIRLKSLSGSSVYALGSPIASSSGVSYDGTENAPQLGGSAFL